MRLLSWLIMLTRSGYHLSHITQRFSTIYSVTVIIGTRGICEWQVGSEFAISGPGS